MTLEEKIKTKMDEYYVNKNIYGQTPIFEDGAKWMLSELKPVMEEMKEALTEIILKREVARNDTDMFVLLQTILKSKEALSKYNELFKK